MTTQVGGEPAAQSGAVASAWLQRGAGDASLPANPEQRAAFARRLVEAAAAATRGDLAALRALYRLDQPPGAAGRTGLAISHLQRLAAAAGGSLAARVEAVIPVLAADCVSRLEAQTGPADRGPSLAVTMHELRRPLTILSSYGQLLSSGMLGDLPESALVAVEGITASTEMMVRMVSSLTELARLEDPDDRLSIEPMTVAELVRGAVDQVRTEAKLRDIRLRVSVADGLRVAGDRRRLTLALVNLLSNAIKHGPSRSSVEIAVLRDGDRARFLVRDHGDGFPERDGPHLFEKYFRSVSERRRKVPGSGLGLYIVRTVAERHGGAVAARSLPGEGAEFEMMLPVLHDDAERA